MKKLYAAIPKGVTAKLNFDYACQRGHTFNEYALHYIINEIIASNINSNLFKIKINYAAIELNKDSGKGRKKEVDFAIIERSDNNPKFFIEAKWAKSSHCKTKNIIKDLARLQTLKNSQQNVECLFVLAGPKSSIMNLFKDEIFSMGSNGLLLSPFKIDKNQSENRIKRFQLKSNPDHQEKINKIFNIENNSIEQLNTEICRNSFEVKNENFPCFMWRLHK